MPANLLELQEKPSTKPEKPPTKTRISRKERIPKNESRLKVEKNPERWRRRAGVLAPSERF